MVPEEPVVLNTPPAVKVFYETPQPPLSNGTVHVEEPVEEPEPKPVVEPEPKPVEEEPPKEPTFEITPEEKEEEEEAPEPEPEPQGMQQLTHHYSIQGF